MKMFLSKNWNICCVEVFIVKKTCRLQDLASFFYLCSKAKSSLRATVLSWSAAGARSTLKTVSGGEFDWGGTSVKEQRRCPKASSARTETSHREKARLVLIFSMNTDRENVAYRSLWTWEFQAGGVRKVTTGITGLWQPSVHSDVAFWFFDVGSSECTTPFQYRCHTSGDFMHVRENV